MTDRSREDTDVTPEEGDAEQWTPRVPAGANHGAPTTELPSRWRWVEPCVWTPRMVQALETGVKGGVWYSLWDKVIALPSLRVAYAKVKANRGAAGADHMTIALFERDAERHLKALHESLKAGMYRPSAIRRCFIPKAGSSELRPLGIPTVRDRVVQAALRAAVEPIFEREFADPSYGYRPERDAHQAIDRVEQRLCEGRVWVVDVDLKSFFDTVPFRPLMARIREHVADGKVLGAIEATLRSEVVEEDGRRWSPLMGTPQGGPVSPLLSNVYLNPLDHWMVREGYEMTRYADDMVIQCRSEEEAERALARLRQWCGDAGLLVHPVKTRVVRVSVTEGFDFLGYHFRQHRDDPRRVKKWPREKSVAKLRDTLRPLTKRTNGHSLEEILRRVNRVMRGFFQYFRKSVKTPLVEIDKWARGRLRSILRRRSHRRGRGRGKDHQTWPNAFFEDLGLFSLARALEQTVHSPSG